MSDSRWPHTKPERLRNVVAARSAARSIFLLEHDLFGKTGTHFFRIML
jgi:hypothetical protein